MAPKNHPESMVSGAACVLEIDFATDSLRRIVADATTGVKATRCGRKTK
jgi:hypothetical protein